MTISDLHCDVCKAFVPGLTGSSEPVDEPGPTGGVRFVYHPGRPQFRDTSGLMCGHCWAEAEQWLGARRSRQCAVCGAAVDRHSSLHVHRFDETSAWRLCAQHSVEFLNRLRTVQPKLDPATFRFPSTG